MVSRRREMAVRPPGINRGEGSNGPQSVFLSFFMLSCSSHRDDNQLTSQCFKLSSLQKETGDSRWGTAVTANFANSCFLFRHYEPWKEVMKGCIENTSRRKRNQTKTARFRLEPHWEPVECAEERRLCLKANNNVCCPALILSRGEVRIRPEACGELSNSGLPWHIWTLQVSRLCVNSVFRWRRSCSLYRSRCLIQCNTQQLQRRKEDGQKRWTQMSSVCL